MYLPLCLSCHDATFNMQHELPGSDLMSNFQIELSGSNAYVPMSLDVRNTTVWSIFPVLLSSEVIWKENYITLSKTCVLLALGRSKYDLM